MCVSSKRLIVVDAVYDRFLEKYREDVAALQAGDPMDPATTLAPLSSKVAADRLTRQVAEAVADGAHAETIGEPVPTQGAFYQPTILTSVTPANRGYTIEMFGPVTQLFRVSDEQEAVRVAAAVDTGMMYINHPTGVETSGYGHELIDLGLHEFVNIKAVVDTPSAPPSDIDGSGPRRRGCRHAAARGPGAAEPSPKTTGLAWQYVGRRYLPPWQETECTVCKCPVCGFHMRGRTACGVTPSGPPTIPGWARNGQP